MKRRRGREEEKGREEGEREAHSYTVRVGSLVEV